MTDWKTRTKLVHEGTRRSQYGEMAEAIFLTQGFVYPTAEDAEARFVKAGEDEFIYARYGNPTTRMFEERIAAHEGLGERVDVGRARHLAQVGTRHRLAPVEAQLELIGPELGTDPGDDENVKEEQQGQQETRHEGAGEQLAHGHPCGHCIDDEDYARGDQRGQTATGAYAAEGDALGIPPFDGYPFDDGIGVIIRNKSSA